MTVVQVGGGACGFTTRIQAVKEGRHNAGPPGTDRMSKGQTIAVEVDLP